MPPADVRELLGAYALGALERHERELVEHLLARSPEARAELERHRHVAEYLGTMAAATPPDDVWERIGASVGGERGEVAGDASAVTDLAKRRRRSSTAGWLTAVAAAALALTLGLALVTQTRRVGDLNQTIASRNQDLESMTTELAAREVQLGALNDTITVQNQRADQLGDILTDRDDQISELLTALSIDPLERAAQLAANDSEATLVNLAAPEVGQTQVTVVVLEDGRGYVTSSSLVPLEAERTYQLWAVMDDGRIISAAVLGSRPGVGTFVVDLEHLTALAITEEIEGGVVTSENDAVVVGEVNA